MDLFDHARESVLAEKAPLAARMRPRTLAEFVGQLHILGPGRLLSRAIQADQLSSLIFYGPPGTGKTTLARIIANTTSAHFEAINAVLAGVADIRKAVAGAEERLGQHARRTILFVDEVHRFNKAQQDALLPHVEFGTLILIGATTENPYFEVNKTVLSRSRIFELRPLGEQALKTVLLGALADAGRGYGKRRVELAPEALDHLARVANGDARAALNALELAVETTPAGPGGVSEITLEVAEESIQRKAVLYDKEGDAHFDTVSAFIKSLRGSDPDAALYWMARMVYAGEDPRFLFRRMLIFAAEDVGLADPGALAVVTGAARAFDYVGLPEGRFHLAEACLYLATAPKSNSAFAFFDALATVERERAGQVPGHLKDANRDAEGLGHGAGYLYPHSYRDHWVAQQYLPDSLQGRVFYQPGENGLEAERRERVLRLREAQLEALAEPAPWGPYGLEPNGGGPADGDPAAENWLRRSQTGMATHLAALRERIFALAAVQRHHLVLDANAGGGLLTWEALRLAREGGAWARTKTAPQAQALAEQARAMPALAAPVVIHGPLEGLPAQIPPDVRFDRILARGLLGRASDAEKQARIALLGGLLAPGGALLLAEPVPRLGGRILAEQDWSGLPPELANKVVEAEQAIYADEDDPLVNWDDESLRGWCRAAGLSPRGGEVVRDMVETPLEPATLERWFGPATGGDTTGDPAGGRLHRLLGADAARVRRHLEQRLAGKPLRRKIAVALLLAEKAAGKAAGKEAGKPD
ncbi:MAG: AAA family ATPase [bacterium]